MNNVHKLFCIPFAGGSSSSYSWLKKYIGSDIELNLLDFPGRGKCSNVKEVSDMQELIDFLYKKIINEVGDCNYSVMGHSMGGYIAYEIACMISVSKIKMPKNLILSGTPINDVFSEIDIENINKDDFKDIVIKNQWIDEKILKSRLFEKYIYGTLLHDLKLVSNYTWKRKDLKKYAKVYIFYGEEDQYSIESYYLWNKLIGWEFLVLGFPGGHFFVLENQKHIAKTIKSIIYKENINDIRKGL